MFNYFFGTKPSPSQYMKPYRNFARFTYRSDFEPIPGTRITSDSGWGCCYRCCQGFLCNYIIRINENDSEIMKKCFGNKKIFELFMDLLSSEFSIQNLAYENKKLFNLQPGKWGKPSQIAHAISEIMKRNGLSSYVSLNCIIEPKVIKSKSYPILLMISLMCGLNSLDPSFGPFLKYVFSLKENLGIVSGYYGSAYYIVDINESDEVLYYDPHTVNKAVKSEKQFDSFFEPQLHRMKLSKLNPSTLICFECIDEESTNLLIKNLTEFPNSPISYLNILY